MLFKLTIQQYLHNIILKQLKININKASKNQQYQHHLIVKIRKDNNNKRHYNSNELRKR